MELLLVRQDLNSKPKKISIDKIKEDIKNQILYFDKDNSHKDIIALVNDLESNGYSVNFREIKYGLSDEEYMYEVHVL
jgi:hypothetical protein